MTDTQWNNQMFELCELGQFLLSFNVIDIDFTNGEKIDVYLALTKEQRVRGLSNLSSLDVGGMLFCYDQPSYVPFSMAQMKMDLDIAWFDKNGIMIESGTFKAGDETPKRIKQDFFYVLECPAGTMPNSDMVVRSSFDKSARESYAIPSAVKNNARSGLELRKKFGRGGTSVGENTARTLAAGGSIGIEKVRHIAKYFPRHAGDNLDDKTSNGWIAWQLWGGHAARSWANGIVARANRLEEK